VELETRRPPYTSYAAIMTTFAGGLAAAGAIARLVRRDPQCHSALDFVVLSAAAFKASRTLSHDEVTSFIREPFVDDIRELRETAGNLDENKAELDRALQVLPIKLQKVGRTAIYGSWFNFYLCDYSGQIRVGGQTLNIPAQHTGSERCDLP